MAQTRLFSGPPTASIEALIVVYPAAILVLYRIVTGSFSALGSTLSRQTLVTCVIMIAGLCCLSKKPTARAIAATLGVVSHDALTRLLTRSAMTATLLMNALLSQALLLSTGAVLPSYLALDDVLVPKPFSRWIAGAYWDWDHAQRRTVFGHRLVVIIWTNGVLIIPVAFALWHKRHSAYFLTSVATFTTREYDNFLTRCPTMKPLLASLLVRDDDVVRIELARLATWQRTRIDKTAWAIIARHAANQRRYRTKNELARCLVYTLVRKGLTGDYITFDSWYASKENLNMLTRLGLVYYAAIPCSRTITTVSRISDAAPVSNTAQQISTLAAGFATRDYTPYPQGHLRAMGLIAALPGLTHQAKLVILKRQSWRQFLRRHLPADHPIQTRKASDPNVYLLTNNLDTPTYQVILRYRSRWTIEVSFRDMKQHTGMGACQHRNLDAVTRHVALVMFAYVCLQLLRQTQSTSTSEPQDSFMTIGGVKKHLQSSVLVPHIEGTAAEMVRGEQRPMPRQVFDDLTDSEAPYVIGFFSVLGMAASDFKESSKNA